MAEAEGILSKIYSKEFDPDLYNEIVESEKGIFESRLQLAELDAESEDAKELQAQIEAKEAKRDDAASNYIDLLSRLNTTNLAQVELIKQTQTKFFANVADIGAKVREGGVKMIVDKEFIDKLTVIMEGKTTYEFNESNFMETSVVTGKSVDEVRNAMKTFAENMSKVYDEIMVQLNRRDYNSWNDIQKITSELVDLESQLSKLTIDLARHSGETDADYANRVATDKSANYIKYIEIMSKLDKIAKRYEFSIKFNGYSRRYIWDKLADKYGAYVGWFFIYLATGALGLVGLYYFGTLFMYMFMNGCYIYIGEDSAKLEGCKTNAKTCKCGISIPVDSDRIPINDNTCAGLRTQDPKECDLPYCIGRCADYNTNYTSCDNPSGGFLYQCTSGKMTSKSIFYTYHTYTVDSLIANGINSVGSLIKKMIDDSFDFFEGLLRFFSKYLPFIVGFIICIILYFIFKKSSSTNLEPIIEIENKK